MYACKKFISCKELLHLLKLKSIILLVGQPWFPTILFSVPWHSHFEIHFAGRDLENFYCKLQIEKVSIFVVDARRGTC